jgi:hypothetical protein
LLSTRLINHTPTHPCLVSDRQISHRKSTRVKWLEGMVASYQMPRFMAFVPDFDRTPSQRIMKHRLQASTEGCWDRFAEPSRKRG